MITVYSKSNCQECEKLFNLLCLAEVEYAVEKVDENPAARSFLVGEGHRAVPQVYKGVVHVGGYRAFSLVGVDGIKNFIESVK